ncbi:hypothetical protein RIF29_16137 [Crotalaria pallida]|uniref:Uncharacterized protein n=1 Tax=Crotalaria pallida TaxID=3830 RepID=A0AAN9FGQ1_CROPI
MDIYILKIKKESESTPVNSHGESVNDEANNKSFPHQKSDKGKEVKNDNIGGINLINLPTKGEPNEGSVNVDDDAIVNYSGPVKHSNSNSLQSDGSTTSTGSFTFPTLEPEWNNSPVRMAKAEKKDHRKCICWGKVLCFKY